MEQTAGEERNHACGWCTRVREAASTPSTPRKRRKGLTEQREDALHGLDERDREMMGREGH